MKSHLQNYKNHRYMEPVQYYILLPMGILLIVASITEWISYSGGEQGLWQTIVNTALYVSVFVLGVRARMYALIAQDRAIRAEEQFRYFLLTGKPLDPALNLRQVIALRFASDEEFPALAQKAVSEQLTADQIKQSIQHWRGDTHRV